MNSKTKNERARHFSVQAERSFFLDVDMDVGFINQRRINEAETRRLEEG